MGLRESSQVQSQIRRKIRRNAVILLAQTLRAPVIGRRREGINMTEIIDRSVWINYFNEFTRRNLARPTELSVFGENGAQTEGHRLPFAGISLERGNGAPNVEIMFSDRLHDPARHLTHVIANVRQITPKRGLDGRDEALAIVDGDGETSLLRFDHLNPDPN